MAIRVYSDESDKIKTVENVSHNKSVTSFPSITFAFIKTNTYYIPLMALYIKDSIKE